MSGADGMRSETVMPSAEFQRHLCVSIHDVAPANWQLCERLLAAVSAVANVPLTLLVVPAYHGDSRDLPWYDRELAGRLALGDELALHGYVHLDQGPPPRSLRQRYARYVYTSGEGEFAALTEQEAAHRLALGRQWFACRGWPLQGFVPPAWLLGEGGWRALRASGLLYTTTWRHFHFLQDAAPVEAPSLVYSSRNAWGRALSRQAVSWASIGQRDAPLARLSLHPRDALDARTVRHFQRLLASLLARRLPATKADFARYWLDSVARPAVGETAV
jgi:predicted deacetylase